MKISVSIFTFGLMALSLTACSNGQTSTQPNTTSPTNTSETQVPTGDYVGMSVSQAQAKAKAEGVPFRVTMADGEPFAVTMDYRIGRINAVVENGVVGSYSVEGQEEDMPLPEATLYDQDSWKTMIPETCRSFFDGCNNCNRMEGLDEVACTRMFCNQYQRPVCLEDQVINPEEITPPSRGRNVFYRCDEGNEFRVSYDEYISGDSIMKLQSDQIMFSDTQTRTATVMNRTVAASGEKYQSEKGVIFWTKSSGATVLQGEENLYLNCEEV